MTDNEQLKIELLKACGGDVAAAYAALEWLRPTRTTVAPVSAKPATKTVEVWRVEYAKWNESFADWNCLNHNFVGPRAEQNARDKAGRMDGFNDVRCIHVTGPHKQEVPT